MHLTGEKHRTFSVLMTSFSMPKTTTFLAITPCYDGNKAYAKAMIMTFGCLSLYHKKGKEKIYRLIQLTHTPILRYTQIRPKANPFDPRYDEYFKQRQETKSRTRPFKCSA